MLRSTGLPHRPANGTVMRRDVGMMLGKLAGASRPPHPDADQTLSRERDGWRLRLVILALSCGLGLAYAYIVVGPRVLNPFNVSGLVEDPATEYLGWAFFRQEPHLTLPLGWSSAIGYPMGEPIAYLDAVPLLAAIFWMIRDFLPETFQYLGVNFVLCCVLQFYFGYRITRRLCAGDRVAALLGAVLFLTAPAFTWRAFGHFALISHWVILAALDQFLHGTEPPSLRRIAWQGILCFIAGGISPYITAMTFMVMFGTYLRTLLCQRNGIMRLAVGLTAVLSSGILALLLFGFLRGTDLSQYTGEGYGKYSMNLLAPIDPLKYGALLLRQQPIRDGQYEGYNYLGLGLLLIGFITISRKPSILRGLMSVAAVSALAIFVLSLVLALSTLGKAGTATLWHVTLPRPVMNILVTFRGSGRLFWPGYYLLFIGIIWSAFQTFPGRLFHVLLAIALTVQVLDLQPLRESVRDYWRDANAPKVSDDPAWHDLGRTQRHLVVLPPWQCFASPGGADGYLTFGRLAVEQHMTINSFYAGRYSDAQMTFFCREQLSQTQSNGLQADSAYVFNKSMVASIFDLKLNGKYCRNVDQLILCSNVSGKSGADSELLRDAIRLDDGEVVSFAVGDDRAGKLLGFGWAGPELWGRWMQGHQAAMAFTVQPHPQHDVRIVLSLRPYVPAGHPVQHVDIQVNGTSVSRLTLSNPQDSDVEIAIPAHLVADDGSIRLKFDLPDAVSPSSLGQSVDAREISVGVKQLRVADAGR